MVFRFSSPSCQATPYSTALHTGRSVLLVSRDIVLVGIYRCAGSLNRNLALRV